MRAALDTYGVPYTYFADQKLKGETNLRSKYDVIIFPHVGGTAQSQVNGMAMTGQAPLPYKKTDKTPNLGFVDQTDDIRGGMGLEGLTNLAKFVQEGGTLITEGSTTTIFPAYAVTSGVTVETPAQLFVRGSILRGKWSDAEEPARLRLRERRPAGLLQPVAGAERGRRRHPAEFAAFFGGGGAANAGLGQNITPNAQPLRISPFDAEDAAAPPKPAAGRCRGASSGRWRGSSASASTNRARAWCCRSRRTRTTCCCRARSPTASSCRTAPRCVDVPLGKGHVVMFAIRPFWRWQTQGTYSLGFNAIMNWNDLDAGKAEPRSGTTSPQ